MGEVSGTMSSDARIRVAGGGRLPGEVRLPELPGVQVHRQNVLETHGRLLDAHPALSAVLALAGAGAGALLVRGPVPLRMLTTLLGGAVAVSGAAFIRQGMQRLFGGGAGDSTAHVEQRAEARTDARIGQQGEHVRMMSWNVHDLLGPDGTALRRDGSALEAIREAVRREQPDVLVLQEVSQTSDHDGLAELARELGATDAVLVPNGVRPIGGAKGGAILTFGDARIQDARGLRHADLEGDGALRQIKGTPGLLRVVGKELPDWVPPAYLPRTTSDAIITTAGGTDVRILGVHLSGGVQQGGDDARIARLQAAQLGPLVRSLDAWKGPTLIAGDFNVDDRSEHYRRERELMAGADMRDALAEAGKEPGDTARHSYPSGAARRGIDRAWVSSHVDLADARVIDDGQARLGSDHLPIVTDVVVR